ncbi:hypothetical protein [Burkholderia gladioli]|uniref:hypothetical protein n=1 Tax=Burkholderia gladioli TaxID=28095 RepID=UPI000CFE5ABC|nr:hypothetical protein [Burkholderia gladioli]MBJ9679016.1 hypothetical protein [Burkholderia gladioli]MDN7465779.1 hypothetical protein [Burkholderia gladioli]MDN7814490.1 hypothetical protein [Burkholderia gladioli]PRE18291.1 hypothetical protein C6P72_22045 [Burkholderia gladioli]
MAPYTHRTIDQHDRSIRQKQRDDNARADIDRTQQRRRDDATLDSNATKWRYPPFPNATRAADGPRRRRTRGHRDTRSRTRFLHRQEVPHDNRNVGHRTRHGTDVRILVAPGQATRGLTREGDSTGDR